MSTFGWLVPDTMQYPRSKTKQLQVLRITPEQQDSASAIIGAALAVSGRSWPMLIPPPTTGATIKSAAT
jgi:hypothetical protein